MSFTLFLAASIGFPGRAAFTPLCGRQTVPQEAGTAGPIIAAPQFSHLDRRVLTAVEAAE